MSITLVFTHPQCVRVVTHKYIAKYIPRSVLGTLITEQIIEDLSTLTITDYSADEWDTCIAISKGLTPLYTSGDRIREVFQRYFGGKDTDLLWMECKEKYNGVCQGMLNLLSATAGATARVVVAPTQRAYALLRPLCTPNVIPFQLITLNDNFFQVCFDHGVPLFSGPNTFSVQQEGCTLYQARKYAVESVQRNGVRRLVHNDAYGNEGADLVRQYTGERVSPQHNDNWSYANDTGPTGPAGPAGPTGPTGPINGALTMYHHPCGDHCIITNPNISVKCLCFRYHRHGLGPGSRDHLLDHLISLSSLDEVRFVLGMANTVFSIHSVQFVDLVPNLPNPHTSEQYLLAHQVLSAHTFCDDDSVHTTSSGTNGLLMKVFVGFVRI